MGEAKTLSLASTSDLVVKCPWTPGIIEADEPLLPRTRLALTFGLLFQLRKRARESLQTAFADPIERLEQIHSFRLAAEEDGLRLAVTYDFGWESYMRGLKEEGGPLMDLLCCHCAGYPLARHAPLPAWQAWIAKNQVPSDYFYSATSLTVCDLAALTETERLQRDEADLAEADRRLAGLRSASAEQVARAARRGAELAAEARRQAMVTLIALYRLTRYWTADVVRSMIPKDAITLVLATRAMLQDQFLKPGSLDPVYEQGLATELEWYRQQIPQEKYSAERLGASPEVGAWRREDVQRGILTSFDDPAPISHGAVVFLAVSDAKNPQEARRSLAGLKLASEGKETGAGEVFRNLALTYSGLDRLGLAPSLLQAAPRAFRDGAAARAGSVGDVRSFHPSHWRPLRRNWEPKPAWEVDSGRVDLLVQLRVAKPGAPTDIADPDHPLRAEIEKLASLAGLELLAVEAMAPAGGPGSGINHFGFADGMSQPVVVVEGPAAKPWSDSVEAGALLVGRGGQPADSFWRDGSFLAVRRMPMDRARFDAMIASDATPGLGDPDLLAAKLLGRRKDGTLLDGNTAENNNFTFEKDKYGAVCPLDSHIRRANPRGEKPPRIMRRGMSFGPPMADPNPNGAERGSYFMAYCADLAEQYERVLGWVNGGNSTRIGSYRSDPMTGVPEHSPRTFKFVNDDVVHRLALPDAKNGAIGLSWSLYLFAPSLPAIRALADLSTTKPAAAASGPAELGRLIIASLQKAGADANAWRSVLNEPGARDLGYDEAVWAAIRADGGILDSPAGYLVGSYDLVIEVLQDDGQRFSNRGAGRRIEETIGRFHLGLDPYGEDYKRLSEPANKALRSVDEETAFERARKATRERVHALLSSELANEDGTVAIDLLTNLIEPMLGDVAPAWFDIPDGTHVEAGAHDWKTEYPKPRYPGDFWNPSRHAFNPFTSRETERMAVADGKATVAAAAALVAAVGRDRLQGSVSGPMGKDMVAYPDDAALVETLVGCMIGGVPTVASNAARMLVDGLESGDLERFQWPWLLKPDEDRTFKAAHDMFAKKIAEKLQHAPVPELLWRLVARDGDCLGDLPLDKGRTLIFSLESAGRDRKEKGRDDNYIPYGLAPPHKPGTPHGCPGREMANGILLGLLVGLLESARFRPIARVLAEIRRFA